MCTYSYYIYIYIYKCMYVCIRICIHINVCHVYRVCHVYIYACAYLVRVDLDIIPQAAAAKSQAAAAKLRLQKSCVMMTTRLSLVHLIPNPPPFSLLGPHVRQPRFPPRIVRHSFDTWLTNDVLTGEKSWLRTEGSWPVPPRGVTTGRGREWELPERNVSVSVPGVIPRNYGKPHPWFLRPKIVGRTYPFKKDAIVTDFEPQEVTKDCSFIK